MIINIVKVRLQHVIFIFWPFGDLNCYKALVLSLQDIL